MVRLRNGITMLMGMIVGAWLMWQLSARVREDAAEYRRMTADIFEISEMMIQERMEDEDKSRTEVLADYALYGMMLDEEKH